MMRKTVKKKAHPMRASPVKKAGLQKTFLPPDSIPRKIAADVKQFFQDKLSALQRTDKKKLLLLNFPYVLFAYFFNKICWLYRVSVGESAWDKFIATLNYFERAFESPLPSFHYQDLCYGILGGVAVRLIVYYRVKKCKEISAGCGVWFRQMGNRKRYTALR